MIDEDDEEGPFPRARKFAWQLVAAAGVELTRDMFAAVADGLETVTHMIVAHERWRDENAKIGHEIEKLVDVSPFE